MRDKQSRPSRRLASLPGAAEYLGCNPRTIRRRISDGTIRGYKFGPRLVLVDLDEIDEKLRPIPVGDAS